jgi:flagellum-specific ATP synthase
VATYEENRDVIVLGAYRRGSDARLDHAIAMRPEIEAFLRQGPHESVPFERSIAALKALARRQRA